MIWNCALLVLGALPFFAAQQTITIPIDVAGTVYEVSFPAGSAANGVAREFCVRNAAAFGITTEDQLPGCIGPVADYLVNAATPRRAEEPAKIRVPMTIKGKQYSVDFAAGSRLDEVAREFCVRNAADFGITLNEQVPNCAGPVADFLSAQTPKASPLQVLTIPINVGGKAYEIKFAPGGVVPLEVAAQNFCVENAASLGLTRDEELPGCVGPVAEYLRTAVNPKRTEQPRMIMAKITVGGNPYEITYPVGLPLEAVAQEFCVRNAAAFGITTNEQLPGCISPVAEYLFNAANPRQQKEPEMLTIPLTIGEKTYQLTFPAGSAANIVAQEFCVTNAASIGITTNEQLPGCVGPVSDYLISSFAK